MKTTKIAELTEIRLTDFMPCAFLWTKCLKTKSSAVCSSRDWLNYKECRNSVNTKLKRAKGLGYNNAFQVNAGEPRATWRVVNELYATYSNVNETKMNGHSIVDAQELAETFIYHLTSIELKLASVIPMVIVLS